MAATNKCLAQSDKSRTGAKRLRAENPFRQSHAISWAAISSLSIILLLFLIFLVLVVLESKGFRRAVFLLIVLIMAGGN